MLEKLPDVVGHLLHDARAGIDQIASRRIDLRAGSAAIAVTSLAFVDRGPIPARYTADGPGVSPPLQWSGVPPQAASVVLLVEDADAPTPHPLVHAIVVNLPAGDGGLAEAALDSEDHVGTGLETGPNSFLRHGWLPPDPPPGHGVHRYAFQVYALDRVLAADAAPGREALVEAVREHALAGGCLIGTYARPDGSVMAAEPPAAAGTAAA